MGFASWYDEHVVPRLIKCACSSPGIMELREQVVEVAREYFNVPQKPNLDIVVADARFELRGTPDNSTDLVFSDLYFASEMNLYQRQKKFIQHCHRILTDEGWLVINFHRLPSLDAPFFNWIGALFPALFAVLVARWVAVAGPQALLLAPFAWVATEVLRAYTFFRFPWCLLGYSQQPNLPVIQLSRYTAVYGVSFLLALASAVLAYVAVEARPDRRRAALVGLALALGAVWFYALITGMNLPVVRGALMASLFLIAEALGRQRGGVTALAFSAARS